MGSAEIISSIKKVFPGFEALSTSDDYPDQFSIKVRREDFRDTCLILHKILPSPVMMLFALDERRKSAKFLVNCVFVDFKNSRWITVTIDIPQESLYFSTLAKNMHSASLFEREIQEMFGIEPKDNPDLRRLRLHDEILPEGNYPLRKDFQKIQPGDLSDYKFARVEGEGIFEVPVGPVHAGIIGAGHFRFSSAGEPVINLESRLGFTHRGVEKLFEGKLYPDAVHIAECVCGDSSFAHSLAFVQAAEKISGVSVSTQIAYQRAIFLELERMYNHVSSIGGIAIDVGFSFPAAYAAIIKEAILQLNYELSASRYLRGINTVGGILTDIDESKLRILEDSIKKISCDFNALVKILNSSVSFMDRVDATGVLKMKTAQDLGVVGLIARASGIPTDLRRYFPGVYREAKFKMITQQTGDVLARLNLRIFEFAESCRLIDEFAKKINKDNKTRIAPELKQGSALGYVEGCRGPVLYWLKIDREGLIERCKIVDPSFVNWQGLSYAVLGNIIPDFPVCNKSFDLSYSGNDL